MWRSSDILYLPYIFRTLKRVYKPTVVISTKLIKMSSFSQNIACGYRERAGVDLSDIYVWRMDQDKYNVQWDIGRTSYEIQANTTDIGPALTQPYYVDRVFSALRY